MFALSMFTELIRLESTEYYSRHLGFKNDTCAMSPRHDPAEENILI